MTGPRGPAGDGFPGAKVTNLHASSSFIDTRFSELTQKDKLLFSCFRVIGDLLVRRGLKVQKEIWEILDSLVKQ